MVMGKLAQNLSTWEAQLTSEGWMREGGRGRRGGGQRREEGGQEEGREEGRGGAGRQDWRRKKQKRREEEERREGKGERGGREEEKIKWPLSKQEPAGLGCVRPSALSPPWTGPLSSLEAHQPGAGPGGQGGS